MNGSYLSQLTDDPSGGGMVDVDRIGEINRLECVARFIWQTMMVVFERYPAFWSNISLTEMANDDDDGNVMYPATPHPPPPPKMKLPISPP